LQNLELQYEKKSLWQGITTYFYHHYKHSLLIAIRSKQVKITLDLCVQIITQGT